jgi:hypothetical protein
MTLRKEMNSLWYVAWTEYNGYDCFGHRVFNIFNGTQEDAMKQVDGFEDVFIVEWSAENLNNSGWIF